MRADLARLLADFERAADDETRKAVEADIWRRHGRDAAVFVLDLPGFTRSVVEVGLIGHLSRVNRLLVSTDAMIRRHGGQTIKHEADNCFAAFAAPGEAVQAADECLEMLERHGASASIGIAFGRVLFVGQDYFGHPVNIASRLGEDLAATGEILIEASGEAMLPQEQRARYERRALNAHGVDIVAMTRRPVSADRG